MDGCSVCQQSASSKVIELFNLMDIFGDKQKRREKIIIIIKLRPYSACHVFFIFSMRRLILVQLDNAFLVLIFQAS